MALKHIKPSTPGQRHRSLLKVSGLAPNKPLKKLVSGTAKKHSGRNSTGHITIRHRGGGHKRRFRIIDFKRDKTDILAKVVSIEYDPNRSSNIALLIYADGENRYIIAPEGLKTGDQVVSAESGEIKPGMTMQLKNIPVGTPIHNIELRPGKGGQIVRSAGSLALIQSKEDEYVAVQLPSKEIRLVKSVCLATIGQVSNPEHKSVSLGKAGRKRHMGIRPTVRGTAQHPGSHPHGGGEGRSGVGLKFSKTPWGKPAMGKKTKNKSKYSNKFILKDRRSK